LVSKITSHHIQTNDFAKMRVYLATQLFSESVAAGLKFCRDTEAIDNNCEATILFIEKLDSIFDMLNSSVKMIPGKPFRSMLNCFKNNDQLQELGHWVNTWTGIFPNRSPPSFAGLVQTINGIHSIIQDLEADGYSYVRTRSFQQDCLEHFNAFIRQKKGWNLSPTAKQFSNSFCYFFLSSLLQSAPGTNCEVALDDKVAVTFSKLKAVLKKTYKTVENEESDEPDESSSDEFEETCSSDSNDELRLDCNFNNLLLLNPITSDQQISFQNVAEYVGNWIATKISWKTKCITCHKMFHSLETSSVHQSATLLFHKHVGKHTGDSAAKKT